jgi:hypothetical protein
MGRAANSPFVARCRERVERERQSGASIWTYCRRERVSAVAGISTFRPRLTRRAPSAPPPPAPLPPPVRRSGGRKGEGIIYYS